MAHVSDPGFRVLHALRIKGFAKAEALGELADVPVTEVERYLTELHQAQLAAFREARAHWQLTPAGRDAHHEQLGSDVVRSGAADGLRARYGDFLGLNEAFKELCGEWQLRGGDPNDHVDADYDARVIGRLQQIDGRARRVCGALAGAMTRFGPYGPRLGAMAAKVAAGDHHLFTGVMCGSYHDVWMELHEDLILTLGIDRSQEGSF